MWRFLERGLGTGLCYEYPAVRSNRVRSIGRVKHACGVRVTTATIGTLITMATRITRATRETLEIMVRRVMVVTLKYK